MSYNEDSFQIAQEKSKQVYAGQAQIVFGKLV